MYVLLSTSSILPKQERDLPTRQRTAILFHVHFISLFFFSSYPWMARDRTRPADKGLELRSFSRISSRARWIFCPLSGSSFAPEAHDLFSLAPRDTCCLVTRGCAYISELRVPGTHACTGRAHTDRMLSQRHATYCFKVIARRPVLFERSSLTLCLLFRERITLTCIETVIPL